MRSPADMEFIQIDITNACNMRCSNCTRFCGNHEKPFFMDFETFKRAIDSMDGFEGVTGIIGGEPTLHPEFERFALYLQEKFGKQDLKDGLAYPQERFIQSVHEREYDSNVLRRRPDGSKYLKKHGCGLWSNMSAGYRKYYEMIQDTFAVQYLNDHINPSYHQPGLFARKDLNIPDEEWIPLRDKCWIQNTWSATVTPKGCFFCEVAGALDRLFDGPGGWPIEPGWWKRKSEDFADQLHLCELCGFALEGRTFTRDSQEETDDVSPTLYAMLQKTGSPKLKAGKINAVQIHDGVIDEASKAEDKRFTVGDRYIEKYEDRFHEKNSILFRLGYKEAYIPDGEDFGKELNRVICGDAENPVADAVNDGSSVSGGAAIKAACEWILLKLREDVKAEDLRSMIGKRIFNPGTLHLGDGYAFFHVSALSLRKIGFDGVAHMTQFSELQCAWDANKVIRIADTDQATSLAHETLSFNKRYAIWGAGPLGEFYLNAVRNSGGSVTFFVDKSESKAGKILAGVEIIAPAQLAERMDDYDILIPAHHLCFEEIANEALRIGVPKERILLPYEV